MVEDDRRLRDTLVLLLGGTPGLAVVASAHSMEEALRVVPPARPEVVLLDIHMPGVRGSIGVADLVERCPGVAVLMHTGDEQERIAPPAEAVERLSPQEARLLAAIAEGKSYREAATELGVSINTVRAHIRSVYEKLQVHTRSEAVSKAMRSGQI